MSIIMVADKVLIQKDPIEKITGGGIEIPAEYQKDPNTGTIIAVGPGSVRGSDGIRNPLTAKIGDKVILPENRFGQIILYEGEELIVCREFEIPIIVRPEKVDDGE